jgi:hypothetical protein
MPRKLFDVTSDGAERLLKDMLLEGTMIVLAPPIIPPSSSTVLIAHSSSYIPSNAPFDPTIETNFEDRSAKELKFELPPTFPTREK